MAAARRACKQSSHSFKSILTQNEFVLKFQNFLLSACEVLFFYAPVEIGGLALSGKEAAFIWSLRPLAITPINLVLYPILERRWGARRILRRLIGGLPMIFLVYFVLAILLGQGIIEDKRAILGVLVSAVLIFAIMSPSSGACYQILSSRAPSRAYLTR